jgi:hypothetical protein
MSIEQLCENCIALWERCIDKQKLVKTGIKGVRSGFIKSSSSVALPVWMTGELYSAEDILEEGTVQEKKVKSKAERKLINPMVEEEIVEQSVGIKRGRSDGDDVEKSFEEKRARKLAKKEKVKGVESVKA